MTEAQFHALVDLITWMIRERASKMDFDAGTLAYAAKQRAHDLLVEKP